MEKSAQQTTEKKKKQQQQGREQAEIGKACVKNEVKHQAWQNVKKTRDKHCKSGE
jgi:molybdopterin/thiamine biosynthesis adenylyltransferase